MPRIARVVVVGYPHHITQRGNYRQDLFVEDADREKYLFLLRRESKQYGLKILVYCLMTNHIHIIGVPLSEYAMGNVFKYLNMSYSQYFNKKLKAGGHLFQGRFFSSVMDEGYTATCARYIERNPVRANMLEKPWDWKWSSARVHCGLDKDKNVNELNTLFEVIGERQEDWRKFISQPDDAKETKAIKEQTRKGRPLGSETFIEKIEKKLDRILKLQLKGRPKKNK